MAHRQQLFRRGAAVDGAEHAWLEHLRERAAEQSLVAGDGTGAQQRLPLPEARFARVIVVEGIERDRSEEHTSELQSRLHIVCRLLLEKNKARISHPQAS